MDEVRTDALSKHYYSRWFKLDANKTISLAYEMPALFYPKNFNLSLTVYLNIFDHRWLLNFRQL